MKTPIENCPQGETKLKDRAYTPAQEAARAARQYTRAQVIEMATSVRDCAWPADVKEYMVLIEPMLRAFAATLSQQGEQAGGVDADLARLGAATQTALAQNAQGEAVAEVYEYPRERGAAVPVMLKGIRFTSSVPLPIGTKLYLHAERARAPAVVREVMDELEKAIRKFPTWPTDPLHAVGVFNEEAGELSKAVLQQVYEPHKNKPDDVRKEAQQAAAMALRFLMSLDSYDWTPGVQHDQPTLADALEQLEGAPHA